MARTAILRLYRHDERFAVSEDFEIWARIADAYRIANLPEVLVRRRAHAQQTSKDRDEQTRLYRQAIYARQLEALGVAFEEEDLRRHHLLRRMRKSGFTPDRDLRRLGRGLAPRYCTRQRARLRYPEPALSHLLGGLWLKACWHATPAAGLVDRCSALRVLAAAALGMGGAAQRCVPARLATGLVARRSRPRRTGEPLRSARVLPTHADRGVEAPQGDLHPGPEGGEHVDPSQSRPRSRAPHWLAFLRRRYPNHLVFSFVRNPWSRLVSTYQHKILAESVCDRYYHNGVHRGFVKAGFPFRAGMPFEEFAEFVCTLPDVKAEKHLKSQSHFVVHRGVLVPDYLGRFENIAHDWEELCRRLGATIALVRYNRTHGPPYPTFYTPRLVNLVGDRYREDVERFGYQYDPAAALAPLRDDREPAAHSLRRSPR